MTRSISVSDEKSKSAGGLGSRTKSSLTNMSYLLKKHAQTKSMITTTDRAVDMSESVYCKTSNALGLGYRSKSGVAYMSSLNKTPKSPSAVGEMAIATRPPVDKKTRKSIILVYRKFTIAFKNGFLKNLFDIVLLFKLI